MGKYLYGNEILPELRGYDKTTYPFVIITTFSGNKAYAFRTPPTVSYSGMLYIKVTPQTPYLCCSFLYDDDGREYWSEWETVTETNEIQLDNGSVWANYNITKENGDMWFEGSDPTKVTLPLVLYEGKRLQEKLSLMAFRMSAGCLP